MRDDGSWSKVLQWKWTLEETWWETWKVERRLIKRRRRGCRAKSQNHLMFPNWVPEPELGPCHSLKQGAPEEMQN